MVTFDLFCQHFPIIYVTVELILSSKNAMSWMFRIVSHRSNNWAILHFLDKICSTAKLKRNRNNSTMMVSYIYMDQEISKYIFMYMYTYKEVYTHLLLIPVFLLWSDYALDIWHNCLIIKSPLLYDIIYWLYRLSHCEP